MGLADIKTKPVTPEYSDKFDKAFPKRKKKPYEKTRKKPKRISYR